MSTSTLPTQVQPGGPQPAPIHPVPVWLSLSLNGALLLLINLAPERIGYWVSAADPDSFVPILGPEFPRSGRQLLNIWWGTAMVLDIAKLTQGRWTWALRWADLAVGIVTVTVLAALILGEPISHLPAVDQSLRGLALLILLAAAYSGLRQFARLIR